MTIQWSYTRFTLNTVEAKEITRRHILPPKPYVSMSIRRELYEKLERLYVLLNAKAGRRRFKSMQELLEYLVDKKLKELEK